MMTMVYHLTGVMLPPMTAHPWNSDATVSVAPLGENATLMVIEADTREQADRIAAAQIDDGFFENYNVTVTGSIEWGSWRAEQ